MLTFESYHMSHMQGYLKNDKTNILPLVHPTIFPIFHPVDYYFFTIICLNCTRRLPWYCQSTQQVTVVLAVNPDERHLRPSCRRPELEAELIDLTMVTDHAPLPISTVGTPPPPSFQSHCNTFTIIAARSKEKQKLHPKYELYEGQVEVASISFRSSN